jgi:hypothetical protein
MALVLILGVILTLVSGVYAYWKNTTLPLSSPVTSTVTSYPVEMRTDLNKTEFRQGEAVTISVSLKNISNRTITLHYPSWLPYTNDFSYNITDENGKEVYSTWKDMALLYITRTYTLEPGAEKRGIFGWYQTSNVIVESAYHVFENEKVSKGVYKVNLATGELRSIRFEDSGQTIILGKVDALRTPPIAIVIT